MFLAPSNQTKVKYLKMTLNRFILIGLSMYFLAVLQGAGFGSGKKSFQLPEHPKATHPPIFEVQKRSDIVEKFPCTKCHSDVQKKKNSYKKAHPTIVWNHGNLKAKCSTCHDEKDPGTFKALDKKVSIDESHNLCGVCHFSQKRDWQGGAHGKRTTGWNQKRVIKPCTSCHNPHNPLFPKKRPVIKATPLPN